MITFEDLAEWPTKPLREILSETPMAMIDYNVINAMLRTKISQLVSDHNPRNTALLTAYNDMNAMFGAKNSKLESGHTPRNTDQSDLASEEYLLKNGEKPFFTCLDCGYLTITQQELSDHFVSMHAKVHDGQSNVTLGIQRNSIIDSGFKEEESFHGLTQAQFKPGLRGKSNEDLEKLTSRVMAQMNANCHGVKKGSKNLSNRTAPYQCELCDFTTNRKYDLKGHKRCFHNGKLRNAHKASKVVTLKKAAQGGS